MAAPDPRQNAETICKVSTTREELAASFSEEVVKDVLGKGKPLVFSKDYREEQAALAVETNRLTADLAGVAADLMGSEQ